MPTGSNPESLFGNVLIAFGFGVVQNDVMVSMFGRVPPPEYAVASVAYDAFP